MDDVTMNSESTDTGVLKPLDPEILKDWYKFLDFVASKGIKIFPEYFSIYLWEEFKKEKES